MTSICGMQSLKFENAPYLKGWASVAGKKEGEGPLGNLIDQIIEDPYFGQESWELAEGRFMKQAAMLAISKADLHKKDIRYAFAGDLLEQNTATFSGMKELGIPLFGLFGACSTVGEAMSLAAMSVAGGFAKHSLAIASSHIGSAEKQFRFPLEYGNQRPLSATWTVTGSGGFIVSKEIGPVKIQGITTGKIVDYGMEDPMNMGACMAPAAAEVIYQLLWILGRSLKIMMQYIQEILEKLARRFCCICFVKMDMIFRKFMGIVELKSMRMRRRILILGALAVPVVQWFLHR